jgi:hypothetical protein
MTSPWRAVWARSIAPRDVLEARDRAARMTAVGLLGPVDPPVLLIPSARTAADLRAEGVRLVEARARAGRGPVRRPRLFGRAVTYGVVLRGRCGVWRLAPDCFGASVEGTPMLIDHDFDRVVGLEGEELRIVRSAEALDFELAARSALADEHNLLDLARLDAIAGVSVCFLPRVTRPGSDGVADVLQAGLLEMSLVRWPRRPVDRSTYAQLRAA